MKNLGWIIGGASLALAVYVILNAPAPAFADGYDGVDNAGDRAGLWGAKQRFKGAGSSVLGKLKEGAGRVTGNESLAGEGVADQAAGGLKDAVGNVAQAAGQTLHDLNRP